MCILLSIVVFNSRYLNSRDGQGKPWLWILHVSITCLIISLPKNINQTTLVALLYYSICYFDHKTDIS